MDTNKKDDIDLSGFFNGPEKTVTKVVAPPKMGGNKKRNKAYIIIIIVCAVLSAIFWGTYFFQQSPGMRSLENSSTDLPAVPTVPAE